MIFFVLPLLLFPWKFKCSTKHLRTSNANTGVSSLSRLGGTCSQQLIVANNDKNKFGETEKNWGEEKELRNGFFVFSRCNLEEMKNHSVGFLNRKYFQKNCHSKKKIILYLNCTFWPSFLSCWKNFKFTSLQILNKRIFFRNNLRIFTVQFMYCLQPNDENYDCGDSQQLLYKFFGGIILVPSNFHCRVQDFIHQN